MITRPNSSPGTLAVSVGANNRSGPYRRSAAIIDSAPAAGWNAVSIPRSRSQQYAAIVAPPNALDSSSTRWMRDAVIVDLPVDGRVDPPIETGARGAVRVIRH